MPPFAWVTPVQEVQQSPGDSRSTSSDDQVKTRRPGYFQAPLKWSNIIFLVVIHVVTLYVFTKPSLWSNKLTTLWYFVWGILGGFGVTGGVHRYWTHRTYKAKLPLQIFLAIAYCSSGQISIYDWVRDHRVHHKFSETDADPHNANRGFFFAHVGWLMMKKHPEVIRRGKEINMDDILNDPVASFVNRHFAILWWTFNVFIPVLVPYYFWNESLLVAFLVPGIFRYVSILNSTWLVNSAAHFFGNKPYDRKIQPVENLTVAFFALGEGYHNYHHTFPWDYKAAELGVYGPNFTTTAIDLFAKIGWAYDLKQPSDELIRKVIQNSGDGTHAKWQFGQTALGAAK